MVRWFMSCDDEDESLNNNYTRISKNNEERKYYLRSFIESNLVIIVNVIPRNIYKMSIVLLQLTQLAMWSC